MTLHMASGAYCVSSSYPSTCLICEVLEMIPSRRMYAGAHGLPLEIVMHISTFLCGYSIGGEGWYEEFGEIRLSKKEAGNCSLVCKYWAKIVRAEIFARLLLKTPEDGHQLQSFIERPVSQELSIQRLVKYIHIECNLADPPWLHCVFTSWRPDQTDYYPLSSVLVFNSSDTPSDTPSPRLRSIYESIPRPPPPRMTVIRDLHLKNLVFADFYDLGKLLASIGELRVVRIKDILIKDTEKFCVSSSLSHRIHRDLTVQVSGKNIPFQLIRSILPMRYQHKGTTFCIQPHVLLSLEKALFAVTLAGSPNYSGATRSVSKPGDYYLEVNIDEDMPNYCCASPFFDFVLCYSFSEHIYRSRHVSSNISLHFPECLHAILQRRHYHVHIPSRSTSQRRRVQGCSMGPIGPGFVVAFPRPFSPVHVYPGCGVMAGSQSLKSAIS